MYSRRAFGASALALLSAGCGAAPIAGSETDEDRCEYEAIAEPFDPAADLPPAYTHFQRRFADRVCRRGRATAYYGPRPLKRVSYVEFDGSYYRVQLADSYSAELPALVLSVRWNRDRTPSPDVTVSSFPDLPESDRLALRSAVYGGLYRPQVHPETVLDFSASPVPYPHGTAESTFEAGSKLWIRWEERTYEVTVHGRTEVETPVHEYAAERVAADEASFRTLVDERYVVSLEALTPGERDILDAAVSGGYHETTRTRSPAWDRLLTRLRETETDYPERYYAWYVEYDGDRYTLLLDSDESCTTR